MEIIEMNDPNETLRRNLSNVKEQRNLSINQICIDLQNKSNKKYFASPHTLKRYFDTEEDSRINTDFLYYFCLKYRESADVL